MRRLREKSLSRLEYTQAKMRLSQDVRDAVIINLTPDTIRSSIEVLETAPVRTMDALHIACALAWEADLFSTSDRRQHAAAKTMGLKSQLV